ncbi:MAG: 16S rRNA (guanine(527)-N(7))-methyltransferase RsmG [Nocardioidaceae bacterium]|nr:16S rRNA (guanine(527)-N(7))-methyltransferase RsmG [Nocardioidaceae bacterium]NUS51210.1 16S rRNA (guanine(527)-N(7))-methyltransferase RsmG [Nocardioidaceae bacterium]
MAEDGSVSRETPPAPPVARGVFADRLELAERYADLLAQEGVVRGLIGPREAPRLWERHLLNCAVVAELVPEGREVADIGTGAGLPGIVLAIARPDLRVTLVEPLLRRTTFLEEVVDRLGLTEVRVVRGRAEELHGTEDFDIVTSRAVAPLERLVRWSLPLTRRGGAVLAMKGSSAEREVDEAGSALRSLGAGAVAIHRVGSDVLNPPTTVVRVEAGRASALGWSDADRPGPGAPRARRTRRTKGPRR